MSQDEVIILIPPNLTQTQNQEGSLVLDHCQLASCEGGNCPGCKDGNLFCDDPRCHPNCEDCPPPSDLTFANVLIVILIIIAIIAVIIIIYVFWRGNRPVKVSPYYSLRPQIQQYSTVYPEPRVISQPNPFPSDDLSSLLPTGRSSHILVNDGQSLGLSTKPVKSSSLITGFEDLSKIN